MLRALELGHVCLSLCLAGQVSEPHHVALPIKIIHCVTNHEQRAPVPINLHFEYTHLQLSSNHLWPNMPMRLHI